MIFIRFRNYPIDVAESEEFRDEDYATALLRLNLMRRCWTEVWMYFEGEDSLDWVMLFDDRDDDVSKAAMGFRPTIWAGSDAN